MSHSNKIPMCLACLSRRQCSEPRNVKHWTVCRAIWLLKVVSVSKRRTLRTQHLKGCIFKLMVSTASLAHIRCTLTFSRSLSLSNLNHIMTLKASNVFVFFLHWDLVQNICIWHNHPFLPYPKRCLLHFTALLVICVLLRVKWQGCLILLIFSLWKSRWLYGWRSVRGMWT